MCDVQQGDGEGAAEELEDHADCSGGRHAERVEDVEKDDISHHHGEEDAHHVVEREILRHHDAVARHIHHAVAESGAGKDADGCHEDYGAETCHLCADGGIEEVDCIVAHAHDKVEEGEDDKEHYDA